MKMTYACLSLHQRRKFRPTMSLYIKNVETLRSLSDDNPITEYKYLNSCIPFSEVRPNIELQVTRKSEIRYNQDFSGQDTLLYSINSIHPLNMRCR